MSLKWNGDKVMKRVMKAARIGINKTMARGVVLGKGNHRGWINDTGFAERSIRILIPATQKSRTEVFGMWGSVNVNYFQYLEERFETLTFAAKFAYKNLRKFIRDAYKKTR